MAAATRRAVVPDDWRRVWPCGTLTGGDVIAAGFDARGDLVALDVTRDGAPLDVSALECAELDAALDRAAA